MSNFIPYTYSVHEYINKEGEKDFLDLYSFQAVPSNWEKGKAFYDVKLFLETSLFDLKIRHVRATCTCWDYKDRSHSNGGCKHIKSATEQLNKYVDIE